MNFLFDKILHPQQTIREIRGWRKERRLRCKVQIEHPRMKIVGKVQKNVTGDPDFPTFVAFFGVPYAEPPIGPLRFQPPQPLQVEPGTIRKCEAFKTHNPALQYNHEAKEYIGTEDCLYMNIYLPTKPKNMPVNLPVLVYIHGGGFQRGSGDISEVMPDAIVKQNLLLVTINYRLDVFGFLNLGIDECSGNAALKDQVQALKWIKANIRKFGGDPDNVTLSGHSAGATCVNLHMISPLTKGLFHRAITQAGGIHCPWGYYPSQDVMRKLFAQEYKVENEMRHLIIQTLKNEDAKQLLRVTNRIVRNLFMLNPYKLFVYCGPSMERNTEDAFIPCNVEDLMERAEPVPLIAGFADLEGHMFISMRENECLTNFGDMVKSEGEFTFFLSQILNWNTDSALRNASDIRVRYFPNLESMTLQEIRHKLAVLITDVWYYRFFDNFKIGGALPPQFYVYRFFYKSRSNREPTGPSHSEELSYLYDLHKIQGTENHEIVLEMEHVLDHMCSLWGSFCRDGVPKSSVENVNWKAHSEKEPCYLKIDQESTLIEADVLGPRARFLGHLVGLETRHDSMDVPSPNFDLLRAVQQRRGLQQFV